MLRNCEECNEIFAHPTRTLCEKCYDKRHEAFTAVKDYLKKYPMATVAEVATETEVELEFVYELIREGRLNVVPSDAKVYCDICRAEIQSGRICARCRSELVKDTKPTPDKAKTSHQVGSRIHFLDRIKDQR